MGILFSLAFPPRGKISLTLHIKIGLAEKIPLIVKDTPAKFEREKSMSKSVHLFERFIVYL